MLSEQVFKTIVESSPIISVDILIKKENKVLLGKRINKPAQGYYFSIGGRVFKNEEITNAINRIAQNELNIKIEKTPTFIGVFEHFYDDGIFDGISTHYVNLAYEYEVSDVGNLPYEQHFKYCWFDESDLMNSDKVHKYVKKYFEK